MSSNGGPPKSQRPLQNLQAPKPYNDTWLFDPEVQTEAGFLGCKLSGASCADGLEGLEV